MTAPIEVPNTDSILDPPWAEWVVETNFKSQLVSAREIAAYWADLLQRCFGEVRKATRSLDDVIVVAGFFRAGLKAYDGCLVCLEVGAGGAANMPLRSLWEAELYTKWIVKA